MILGNSAIGGTGLGNFNDPFYNYVTLLLTGANGSNATSNNTFIDNSQYGQTVTRNGDATQGSFTPYNGNYYSNFLNGSTDYISVPANAAFAFGTGDFTVEAWVYLTATAASRLATTRAPLGALAGTWSFSLSGTTIGFTEVVAGEPGPSATIPSIVNQWTHVVACRQSGTTRLFVNGAQVASASQTTNFSSTANSLVIGSSPSENFMAGYISNLRILKGTALYTANFTPPTSPLTAITNTSLLTCQGGRFIDNSINNFTVTLNGTPRVQAFNPFVFQGLGYNANVNGSSMYFDGSGDYLSINYTLVSTISGNFTWECWAYDTGGTTNGTLLGWRNGSGAGWIGIIIQRNNSNNLVVNINQSGGVTITQTSNTYLLNQWNHVALVRSGTTVTLYVNGASAGSGTLSGSFNPGSSYWIGSDPFNNIAASQLQGYVSNQRFVNGTALYTSNFTPPTAPLQPISGTSLLLRGANAAIFDRIAMNDLVTVGNTELRTAITRYNSTSIFFDGTGDYIVQPTNTNYGYGTGDFTIEFWLYLNALTTQTIFSNLSAAASINPHIYYMSGTGIIYFTNNADRITGSALTTGAWNYIAVCRSSGSTRLFINGTQSGSTYTDSNNYGASAPLGIGTYWSSGSPVTTQTLNGYMDDLRVTRGVARYTSTFIPPTYSPLGF